MRRSDYIRELIAWKKTQVVCVLMVFFTSGYLIYSSVQNATATAGVTACLGAVCAVAVGVVIKLGFDIVRLIRSLE